jgi:hypothetical protein
MDANTVYSTLRDGLIGSVCLGVVWGWWTARLSEASHRLMAALAVAVAATVQAAESLWIVGSQSLVLLLIGWLGGFVLHRAVRAGIRPGARATT